MRIYKKIYLLIMILLVSVTFTNVNVAANDLNLVTDAPSAILMEVTTGTVVYEKDATVRRAPASMTKIMTMILVMDAIKNGSLKLDDKLIASENATSMGGTQVYLEVGEEMTVEDLLKAIAIASANDAAVVLAEGVGGTLEHFIEMMNNKASELGLVNTMFKNANGLPELEHYSCSYDMAIMGCYLINNYGETILKYTRMYEDYLRKGQEDEFWLVNTNKLVKLYPEVDGLKTGWTKQAGYCLTATMKKNGIRFVAVVMGGSETIKRNADIMRLLNYGCSTYELINIYRKGDIVITKEDITVVPNIYNIITTDDINVLKKKNEDIGEIKKEILINNNFNDKVGKISIYINSKLYDDVELNIQEEVKKANIISVTIQVMKRLFLG